ncbi:MAG: hypothetical protein ACLPX5_16165 [Dissulfurispiraceae bacterium]
MEKYETILKHHLIYQPSIFAPKVGKEPAVAVSLLNVLHDIYYPATIVDELFQVFLAESSPGFLFQCRSINPD